MNREMIKMNEICVEIVHLATKAACADDEQDKRKALADIYDAIASVLPVDHKAEAATIEQSNNPNNPNNKSNPFHEFYGLKLNRFGGPGLGSKLIGKRVNVDKTVQVFEIDVKRGSLATGARAVVTENGELLFSIVGGKSFAAVERMSVSALHSMLKRSHDVNLRRKLARAAKRAAAAQALVKKEPA